MIDAIRLALTEADEHTITGLLKKRADQFNEAERHLLFGRGELTRAILDVLRDATRPMATREIARECLAVSGVSAFETNGRIAERRIPV